MSEKSLRSAALAHDREPFRVVGAMLTDAGRVRHNNEDIIFFTIPEPGQDNDATGALLLVADGMGGHASGEVASAIAVERVKQVFQSSRGAVPAALAQSFRDANAAVYQHGKDHAESAGLGTTCTAVVIRDGCAFLGHVGDSRAYLYRNGLLRQLSTDHTLVGDLVRSGTITATEAAASPDRNVLLKALGVRSEIEPEIWEQGEPLLLDDRLVLCSDGLSDLVSDVQICRAVQSQSPVEACEALLETALRGGGHDNVSVGVFHIIQTGDISTAPKPRPTRPTALRSGLPPSGWHASIRRFWSRLSRRLRSLGLRSRQFFGGVRWTELMPRGGFLSAIRRKIRPTPRRS